MVRKCIDLGEEVVEADSIHSLNSNTKRTTRQEGSESGKQYVERRGQELHIGEYTMHTGAKSYESIPATTKK